MSFVTAGSKILSGQTSGLANFAPHSRPATQSSECQLKISSEALSTLKSVAIAADKPPSKVGIGRHRAADTFLLFGGPRAVAAAYGG